VAIDTPHRLGSEWDKMFLPLQAQHMEMQ